MVAGLFAIVGIAMLIKSQAAPVLTGDINNDNVVNLTDLSLLLSRWGQSGPGDLNNDSTVNVTDLSILMTNWGRTATGATPSPAPMPPAGSAKFPADITNANGAQWKITLPVVSGGKVVEIKPPQYATYSDKYFHLNGTKDGVVFDVWHGGGTTSNSSNPRSELRERYNNDPEGYWDSSKGTHTLEVVGQVNRLTKVKPQVVIAQVHDSSDDVSTWRVEGNQLWISKGNTPHGHLVDANFQLGKKYTIKYVITNGVYAFFYNGTKVDYTLTDTNKSYFKAGNYLQSNPTTAPSESTSEFSEVVIYYIKVTHG